MATKQNMYVGLSKEAENVLNDIKRSIVLFSQGQDNFIEIIGYKISEAKEIRDKVANLQGKLQIALKGLDKNSPERSGYEGILKQCEHFLEITKR